MGGGAEKKANVRNPFYQWIGVLKLSRGVAVASLVRYIYRYNIVPVYMYFSFSFFFFFFIVLSAGLGTYFCEGGGLYFAKGMGFSKLLQSVRGVV